MFDGFQILMDIPVLIILHSDAGEINETDFPDRSKNGVFGGTSERSIFRSLLGGLEVKDFFLA